MKRNISLDLLTYAFIESGFQVFVPFFPRTSLSPRDCMTRISVVHLHFIWKVLQWNEQFVRSQEAPNEVYNSSMCNNNFSRGVVICLLFKYLIWYRYTNIAGGCYECDISEWYVSAFCHTHTVDKLDRAFDYKDGETSILKNYSSDIKYKNKNEKSIEIPFSIQKSLEDTAVPCKWITIQETWFVKPFLNNLFLSSTKKETTFH